MNILKTPLNKIYFMFIIIILFILGIQAAGYVVDADGNKYSIVKIGNQIWTAENLKTTKFNDGKPIPLVTDKTNWIRTKTPAYCWFDNDIKNKDKYGALYNWFTINTGKLAPKGWHIPNEKEWEELKEYLIKNGYNYDGSKMNNKIAKSMASKMYWELASDTGTIGCNLSKNNKSGFSALPSGFRMSGNFSCIGTSCRWWSITEEDKYNARAWSLRKGSGDWWLRTYKFATDSVLKEHMKDPNRITYNIYNGFYNFFYDKDDGLSIRLLQD